jgi:uncharacterized protein (DUF2267 family)
MLIRGLYYDGWHMREKPHAERTTGAFLAHIEAAFKQDPNEDIKVLVNEAFRLLARKTSPGEIKDVTAVLPPELRALPSCGRYGHSLQPRTTQSTGDPACASVSSRERGLR